MSSNLTPSAFATLKHNTDNLDGRIRRHENGNVLAMKKRLPVTLEFYFATTDKYKAFKFEKYLKSGSGRAFVKKHL